MLDVPMGRRPHGRIATVTVLLAAACALPAPASARTVELSGAPYWHDKVINVGGLGWGTAYGVCPAGPIQIATGSSEFTDQNRVATVPSTSVVPLSGGFSTDFRLLARRRAGGAMIVLTQEEREYQFPSGCGPPHTTRVERSVDTVRPPSGAPCTHGTDCAAPEPHLLISTFPGALPAGASLPPPTPVCPPEGCTKTADSALPAFSPGGELWVQGSGFPGAFYTFREGCQARSTGAISFGMVDRSGTAIPLGPGDAGSGPGGWLLLDDGTFRFPVGVVLPTRGLAYGRAVLTAVRAGFEGDPVCGQVASAPFTISRAQRTVSLETAAVPGAGTVVHGANWGTDACDGKVEVIESRGKASRVIAKVSPGGLGNFDAVVDVKSLGGSGEIEIAASQDSGLEIADERGRPAKAKCLQMPRVKKSFESGTAEVVAPVDFPPPEEPPPEAPPPEEPPPAPVVPTVAATFTAPNNLHVTGTSWDATACPGVQPVQITDTDPRLAGPLALGSTTPDAEGGIAADLDPGAAKAGDAITATQTRCDGTTSSASTTAG